jgi:hypothetical protein
MASFSARYHAYSVSRTVIANKAYVSTGSLRVGSQYHPMARTKRPKFHHFSIDSAESNRVRHVSFTSNDKKTTSVRSSYVELSSTNPLPSLTTLYDQECSFSQGEVQYQDHSVQVDSLSGLSISMACVGNESARVSTSITITANHPTIYDAG